MPVFKALIFDLGHTLMCFQGSWPDILPRAAAELHQTLQQAGIQVDQKTFLEAFQRDLNDYYQQREIDFIESTVLEVLRQTLAAAGRTGLPEDLLRTALSRMYAVSQSLWQTEDEALPTLHALRQRGYRLGILSNAGDDADVQALVDQAGFRPQFDFVLSSATTGIRKPHPRIFELALAQWPDLSPAEAVMVGDTLEADVLGANQAGLFSVWLTKHVEDPHQHPRAAEIIPQAQIENLEELPGLLAALAEK